MTQALRLARATSTPAPPEGRAEAILDIARVVFAEKGFDGASMNDLARAAGMSVGNFYRYFRSKDAIVQALIARDMADIEGTFASIAGSDDPIGALRQGIHARIDSATRDRDGALWAEITAAAARRPEIGEAMRAFEAGLTRLFVQVFARARGWPVDRAQARFAGHAKLILLLVKGSGLCQPEQISPQGDLQPLILRMIDQTLAEILSHPDVE
ncbi:MAG: TetR/AcrR family transcriptional regulator [Rhodobacterales bacterium]|nr:TetR/AcrR family transcriptional regulator [Rhodobacterales bacterium]